MSEPTNTDIMNALSKIKTEIACHNVHHENQDAEVEKHKETLYGNGKRGLTTKVAILSWALGGVGFLLSVVAYHVIPKMFGS